MVDIPVSDSVREFLANIPDVSRVVFFVGAGISVGAGYPLWNDATKRAIGAAASRGLKPGATEYAKEKFADGQYYEVFDVLERELAKPVFRKLAETVFGGPREASEVHELLVDVPGRGIITTNFDECLLSAYVERKRVLPMTEIAPAMASDRFFVVNPHGSVRNPESMVLTSRDWELVESKGELRNLLAWVVNRFQLVFLGYGFCDPDFNTIWDRILRERVFREPALYCCPQGSFDGARAGEMRLKHIHVVQFPDDGSFAFIPEILKALSAGKPAASPSPLSSTGQDPQALERYVLLCLQFSPSARGRLVLVAKALLLDFLASSPEEQFSRDVLLDRVCTALGEASDKVRGAGSIGLDELSEANLLNLQGDQIVVERSAVDGLTGKVREVERAERGWVGGALREQAAELSTQVEPADADRVAEILDRALMEFGRGVAELILFNRPPKDEREKLDDLALRFCSDQKLMHRKELYARAARRLLFEPAEEEEDLFFKKLQSYFLASAYLLDPTSERLLAEYARDHWAYFDSSIILPAMAIGHPSNAVFKRLLHRSHGLGMQLRITGDMINEVWANVRTALKAFREFARTSVPLLDVLEAYVTMYGTGNGNVFLEGFLSQLEIDPESNPSEYMSAVAGTADVRITEAQIASTIRDSFGIQRDDLADVEADPKRLESIITSIEHLRKQGGRFKTRKLCEHEARQFYLIHLRREQNPSLRTKIWYVTTDRFVADLQRMERENFPLPIAYSPRSWFQYLDLIDPEPKGSRHFSRLQPKMRFGVVSGELGIDAIRFMLREHRDLIAKGAASLRELAEAAVGEYHVRQSLADYDRNSGSLRSDREQRKEAAKKVREEVRKATSQFVAVRTQEIEKLRSEKKKAEEEAERLRKQVGKEKHIVRTLKAQQRPRKRRKRRH